MSRTSLGFVTSHFTATRCFSSGEGISRATTPSDPRRSVTTTKVPARAKAKHKAFPIPLPPPVTTTILPRNELIGSVETINNTSSRNRTEQFEVPVAFAGVPDRRRLCRLDVVPRRGTPYRRQIFASSDLLRVMWGSPRAIINSWLSAPLSLLRLRHRGRRRYAIQLDR
mmetsp:Transcript_45026/g.66862  ORF Transcript_45026/g.66862 Transcript_45026/m.66862 type:complete len:169 (+) Transcript_45026:1124-1630(+)